MNALSRDPLAFIKMPTAQEPCGYQAAVTKKSTMLYDAYAVADGLKLQLQKSGDTAVQGFFTMGGLMTTTSEMYLFPFQGVLSLHAPLTRPDPCIILL